MSCNFHVRKFNCYSGILVNYLNDKQNEDLQTSVIFLWKKAIWRLRLQHTWYLYHFCPVQRTGFPCIPLYIHLYYDKILMICFQLIHHKDLKVTQRIILTCFGRKIKLSKIQVILLLMGCIWKMIFSQSIYYSSHLEHKHI